MNKQPNSRSCFACGAENPDGLRLKFYTTGPGEVTSYYSVPEKFQGYPGVVQGGIVATMLDEVVIRAHHMEADGEDGPRFLFTARLDVRYRKPVPTNTRLKIVGTAIKRRSRAATSRGAVYGPDGDLLAEAEAIMIDVPDDMLADSDLESLGWKVYPDEVDEPSVGL